MTLYLDTSVLVSAFTYEAASPRVLTWLGSRSGDEMAISDWVTTVFSAAMSIKLRSRQIDANRKTVALAEFARLTRSTFTVVPVTPLHFLNAARMADNLAAGLRGGDALHLAIASNHGFTVCTLDKDLFAAAVIFGVPAEMPG